MAEYIDRKELEIALNHRLNFLMAENGEYDHYTSGFDDAVTMVENFPSADVEPVVRCRECKHCDPENHHCDHHMGTAAPLRRKPDDFCSYGERKDGDGNG